MRPASNEEIHMTTRIIEVGKHEGETVQLHGWVYRHRASKTVAFIVLRDESGIVQCTAKGALLGKASELMIESSIEVEGLVKKDERAPGGYEIQLTHLDVVHLAERFPITKDQSTEWLREQRHLWLRSRQMTAILKVRSSVFGAIDSFFRSRGYYEFHSPMFTPCMAEGGSTLFTVDYYGKPIFLAQTWQLYAEAAIFSLERIYTIAPSFRSEKSHTSRHLTEYWHAEVETAWQSFDELQEQGEQLVSFICQTVAKECAGELKELKQDPAKIAAVKPPFPRITYEQAREILAKDGIDVPPDKDLRTKEEEALTKHYDSPLIVTRYPKAIKAFYMKEDPEDPSKVLGFDMLVPRVGEIIGASARETDLAELERKLREQGEDTTSYAWYLDTRRYGSVPHAGFGLGVERVVQWLCGLESIQEAIAFPRTPDRTTP
jgi:asparaginyl-tRNA synthetase